MNHQVTRGEPPGTWSSMYGTYLCNQISHPRPPHSPSPSPPHTPTPGSTGGRFELCLKVKLYQVVNVAFGQSTNLKASKLVDEKFKQTPSEPISFFCVLCLRSREFMRLWTVTNQRTDPYKIDILIVCRVSSSLPVPPSRDVTLLRFFLPLLRMLRLCAQRRIH
ncbi:hypothetical protein BDZ97DRAFT_1822496 [Flammula alnicola]|nr:hypothetical protein BDZ97DRAFT_1822496 [Flammula alnicola]